jgi:hypothetical protein
LGLLDRVLTYVNTPFRLFAIVVLAILALTLWVGWENRAELAQTVLRRTVHPHLVEADFLSIAKQLTAVTGGNIVALIKVEAEANIGRYEIGYDTADSAWQPPPNSRPLWTEANATYIVQILEGRVVCYDPTADSPFEPRRIVASWGAVRACIVAVPAITDVLVGALLLAWRTTPSESTEAAARQEIRRAAYKLATW